MLSDFPSVVGLSKTAIDSTATDSTATNSDEKTWTAKEFWDWLDMLLSEHRDKYSDLPEDERSKKINK